MNATVLCQSTVEEWILGVDCGWLMRVVDIEFFE